MSTVKTRNKFLKLEVSMATINVKAEISGSIWKVLVNPGDKVSSGDVLVIIESMKMEIPVEAPVNGIIEKIHIKEMDPIEEEQILISMNN